MNSCSQRPNKSFMQKRVLKTNRAAARAAEELANRNAADMAIQAAEKNVKCSVLYVLLVVRKRPYRLNRLVTDRYTAGIASRQDGKLFNNLAVYRKGLVYLY